MSLWSERRSPAKNPRESTLRIELNAPVLLVLGRCPGNANLTGIPVYALVLNQQHLPTSAAQFQRADNPVVQQRSHKLTFGRVHLLQGGIEQLFLLLSRQPPISGG